ncbi:MAG: cytochrome P450 [Legionella sp.]|nr:cytochrome P450 [Legionella sp.]
MTSSYTLMELKKTTTPTQFSNHLREMGPMFWWAPGNFWVITAYDLAKQVLTSDAFSCDRSPFFISRMPEMNLQLIQDFFKVVSKMMVMSDPPLHNSRRRICYHGFNQQAIQALKPSIQRTVAECVEKIAAKKGGDFISEIAEIIPSSTLAEFFEIPLEERRDFYEWSNNMTQFFGGSTSYFDADGIKVNKSAENLYQYFFKLIDKRRAYPGKDFLSTLLLHQKAFDLTDDEIISQAIMMLVAGQITTTDQMANNLFLMLEQTGLWQTAKNDLANLEDYLEECNRLDPAVTFIFRVAKKENLLHGQRIKKGDVIFISTHAVNRDPCYFPDPDTIKITRDKVPHLSYGYGGHFCLGAKLARVEMHEVFTRLMTDFAEVSFDQKIPSLRKHHSLSFSGFETLGVVTAK